MTRQCSACSGRGYVYVSTVPAKDPVSFIICVIEAFLPTGGKKVRCWRCKGTGSYQAIKTNYR